MSNLAVILQILFITLGMIVIGMILNYILGLKKENLKDMRKKALNLRERMKNAQVLEDYQSMAQLQRESMQFMKLMMRKQLVPMCIRCLIFIGIFVILGFVYADYSSGLLPFPILIFGSGWLAMYLIFSLYFSLIIYVVKKLIGAKGKTQESFREIMEIVSPTRQRTEGALYSTSAIQDDELTRLDSWKKRIEE
ncbi:MAG: EMC3/TMCO1 family protein [Candidatus Thorarchaeota archaeon]